MPDYQKMYSLLFNEITGIIEQLQTVQIKAEELYINSTRIPVKLIEKTGTIGDKTNVLPTDTLIEAQKSR
jgi:hypothetical protein